MKRVLAFLLRAAMAAGVCGGAPSGSKSESASESEAATPELAICMGAEAEGLEMPLVSGTDVGTTSELRDKWDKDVKENGIDGVCLWTVDDSEYELMKKWHDAGVKVVVPYFSHDYAETREFIDANVFGYGWPQSGSEDYFGVDVGAAAADFILSRLAENGITSGSIGITRNGPSITYYPDINSFIASFEFSGSGFTVCDIELEGAEEEEATNRMAGYINEHSDMVAALGTTGGSAIAWSAAKEKTERTDIIVVGLDYTERNLSILEEGGVAGLVRVRITSLPIKARRC